MKTTLMIVALAVLSLSSCKKDYVCECTTTTPNTSNTTTENTGKMKLTDARNKCNEGDESHTVLGETYTTECSLK